jgi:DNA ligase (NAD+)
VAQSVAAFFRQEQNTQLLQTLHAAGVRPVVSRRTLAAGGPLAGATFVFTGGLEKYTRGEAGARVEALGGRVSSGVSRHTSYVVAGKDPGSKLDDAKLLGTVILDEAGFDELLAQSQSAQQGSN